MEIVVKHVTVSLVSALLLVVVACGPQGSAEEPGPLCERVSGELSELPLPADLEAVFDPVVARDMPAMDAVGLAFAVQCGKSPLYVKGYGSADLVSRVPATRDTVYEIGSVSKQFVAAAIMKLAQKRLLSLDGAVGTYLPWLPAAWRPITLRQLLSHTGGVPDHYAIFRENPDTPFDFTRDYSAAELVEPSSCSTTGSSLHPARRSLTPRPATPCWRRSSNG